MLKTSKTHISIPELTEAVYEDLDYRASEHAKQPKKWLQGYIAALKTVINYMERG